MSTPREIAALKKRLEAFAVALRANDLAAIVDFFAAKADFRSAGGIVRGRDEIAEALRSDRGVLRLRASASVISIKWLSKEIALVDCVFDNNKGRGWSTEVWSKGEEKSYLIDSLRLRVGPVAGAFDALNRTPVATLGDVATVVQTKEEAELRKQFRAFRAAFNKGDTEAVVNLCTRTCDAIPVFSFLDGRAQILEGRAAIGAKASRMFGQDVINPDPNARGSSFVGGEPKVVRFLSPTVVVIDGTAEISDIPAAHGFAPREMKGVYANVWRKSGGKWLAEGARAWF